MIQFEVRLSTTVSVIVRNEFFYMTLVPRPAEYEMVALEPS